MENSNGNHWVRTSRPRFWVYLLGPWLLGAFAGAPDARSFLTWEFWVGVIGFSFPANLFVYGVNDIHDTETDLRNAKKSEAAGGYERFLPPAEHQWMMRSILIWNVPWMGALLGTSVLRLEWAAVMALLSFVFFSHGYSAPPIRAKARPIVDSVFNILYACPGFAAYFLMGGEINTGVWLTLGAAWLWCMAMHAFSAVPDIEADRQAGVDTVATHLGRVRTLVCCGLCYVSASVLAGFAVGQWRAGVPVLAGMGLVYALLVGASLAGRSGERVFAVYRIFPFVNAGVGFLLTMLVLFHRWPELRP